MKDTRAILTKTIRRMDKAFHLYEDGKDNLTVAKELIHLHQIIVQANNTLIQEQLEEVLAKPTFHPKDKASLQDLLRLKYRCNY